VRPPRLPKTVLLLGLTSFFTDAGSEMIFPLLPIFLADTLGASAEFLGLVEGAADTVASLLKLVSGALADKLDRRKPLVLFGYALASTVRPFVAIATAPWHVLVVRVADRIGKGVRGAPRDALIADAAEVGSVGRAFGFHRAMDHAGAVVGPLLGTAFLALGLGLRTIFWLAVIPGAMATTLVLFVKEKPALARPLPVPALAPAALLPRSLKSYLAILLLFSIGNSSDAFLLLRAHELGLTTPEIPILWTVLHVSKLVSSYLGGDLSDRVPRARLIVIGWAIYALTYLALAAATARWQAWAIFVVYGVYYGLTEPAEKALVKDLAPSFARGRAFGTYNFVIGVTALPAGLLTGFLWKTYGHFVALALGAAIAAVSAVLLIVWDAKRARDVLTS
jgi:MFS family permease